MDAEDLTEEVFMKAWRALPSYRITKYPFTSWLYRIAHNHIVGYHRRPQPEMQLQFDEAAGLVLFESVEHELDSQLSNHVRRLNELLDQVPEQGQRGIQRALEASQQQKDRGKGNSDQTPGNNGKGVGPPEDKGRPDEKGKSDQAQENNKEKDKTVSCPDGTQLMERMNVNR